MSEDTGKDIQEDAPAMEESSSTAVEKEVSMVKEPRSPKSEMDDEDDDMLGELPEWIKVYSPKTESWYFFNQLSGIKRNAMNGPDYFKRAHRLPYSRLAKRFGAAYRIQMFLRAAMARRKVRIRRGFIWATDMVVTDTRWAELLDLNYSILKFGSEAKNEKSDAGTPTDAEKQSYYYNLDTKEIRWEMPASVMFVRSAKPHVTNCESLKIRYDAIKAVTLYSKDKRAQDSMRLCGQRVMSAISKGKIVEKRVTTVINDHFDDIEEFKASVELLELAATRAEEQLLKLEIDIQTAQGLILEAFSNKMDDISENLEDASTKYWPKNMLSSSKAMLEEVKRAVDTTLDWWAEVTETIPEDVLTYLHPNLNSNNSEESKIPLIDRTDAIPVHPTVEEVGKRVVLLEQLVESASEKGFQNKEKMDQERELSKMRANEAEMRVLLRRERVEILKRERELKFIAECRQCWEKGLKLKENDKKKENEYKAMVNFGAAQITGDSGEGGIFERKEKYVRKYEEMLQLKRLNQYPDPWSGLEGGCTIDVFKQLIADEIERRKNQEKTKFHVDDPDHETKKRLIHSACFWGRYEPMELLVQLGSNVNLLDSIITKFTPLDETARGGQARLAVYLLEHGALKSLQIQNIHGETPIHTAARRDFWLYIDTVFKFLKERGMQKVLKRILVTINHKGQTPRDVATGNPVKELLYDAELELGLLKDAKRRRAKKQQLSK